MLVRRWGRQPGLGAQETKEKPQNREFKLHVSLSPSRPTCYEGGHVLVTEIRNRYPLPFHPSGECSRDCPLLAQCARSVTSVAKLFEERFDYVVKQTLGCPVLRCGCCHIVSPCPACLPVGGGDKIMPRL